VKVGSLFSGMLGLDLAVERATGASLAWACEIER
jgi:site-specific DNA-cytosine methylase